MQIGDKVRFLYESGGGRVAAFQGKNIVLVEDDDGFQIPMPVADVVVVSSEGDDALKGTRRPATTSNTAVGATHCGRPSPLQGRLEPANRISKPTAPPKDLLVIDLHAHVLLGNTPAMSPHEILTSQVNAAMRAVRENSKRKGLRIVLIHGRGNGVLRAAILKELKKNFADYPCQDASFKEYGFGATQVTIK